MFTDKIRKMAENPVVFAEQKMTVPTERLVRALGVAELLNLNLLNLTYLGVPFIDSTRGDFNLLKPRILTTEGLVRPTLGKSSFRSVGNLVSGSGRPLSKYYQDLSRLRSNDFRLSPDQAAWLQDPQEFDMTEFYLASAGLEDATSSSIAVKYLPAYYQQLGEAEIPAISDYDRLALSSQRLIDKFGVCIIDLSDFDPDLDCETPVDFSQRSYIDLSMSAPTSMSPLNLKEGKYYE